MTTTAIRIYVQPPLFGDTEPVPVNKLPRPKVDSTDEQPTAPAVSPDQPTLPGLE